MSDLNLKITADTKDVEAKLQALRESVYGIGYKAQDTAKKLNDTSKSAKELGDTSKKASGDVDKASKSTKDLGNKSKNAKDKIDELSKSFKQLMSVLGKFSIFVGASKIVQSSLQGIIDVIETVNLFNVAMGNYAEQTGIKLNAIGDSAGLDPNLLLQATGNYMLLARSMGVTEKNSNTLATSIVQLAMDISSLYNVDFDKVMENLRSGLLGQTRVIYQYGIDIGVAALKQEALRLGIEKSVNTMTQSEKMYLRYSIMINRSALAQGDFAKTIETPANQLKILNQQLKLLAKSLGSLIINAIGNVLPYINGFVMALRIVISTIAGLLGFEMPKFENTENGFAGAVDESENLGDSIDDNISGVQKLEKEIKNLTVGFDELNVLPDTTQDTGSSGSVSGGSSMSGSIPLPDLTSYESQLEKVRMKATEIRDKILDWLGITREVDEVTGEVTYKLKDGYTRLEFILDIVKVIGGAFLAWKLGETFVSAFTSVKNGLNWLSDTIPLVREKFNALSTVIVALPSNLSKAFKDLPKNFNNLVIVGDVLLGKFAKTFGATLMILGAIIYIKTRLEYLTEQSESFRIGWERVKEVFSAVKDVVVDIGTKLKDKIIDRTTSGLEKIKNRLAELLPDSVKEPVIKFFDNMIDKIKNADIDFGAFIGTLAGIALLFTPAQPLGIAILAFEFIAWLIKKLGEISPETWNAFKQSVSDMWDKVEPIVDLVLEKIAGIIDLFIELADAAIKTLGPIIVTVWKEMIQPTMSTSWKYIKDMVGNLFDTFKGLMDFLIGTFSGDWSRCFTGLANICKSIFNGIITIVEQSINSLINIVNWVIKQVNKIKLPDWLGGAGFNFNTIEKVELKRLEIVDYKTQVENELSAIQSPQLVTNSNLLSNYASSARSMTPTQQASITSRSVSGNTQSANNQPQDIVVNLTAKLDGDTIYKQMQKIKASRGIDFGNPAFAR